MNLSRYLESNFVVGGSLALLFLLGVFVFSNPYLALFLLVILTAIAYRYYRKMAYFE